MFQYDQFFNGTVTIVDSSQIPPGFIRPRVEFCSAVCPEIELFFTEGDFGECSEFCGSGGIQTRNVTCSVRVDGVATNETLDDVDCTSLGMEKPPERQACNLQPCPRYRTGSFGECSQTCRGGVRTREVTCVVPVQDGETGKFSFSGGGTTVDIEICTNFSLQEPPTRTIGPCNRHIPCPVRYATSAFGECDEFSCQQRSVFCVTFNPVYRDQVWPTEESVCRDQRLPIPPTVQSCGFSVCSFGTWDFTVTQNCTVPCGWGEERRRVECLNTTALQAAGDRVVIEDGFCDPVLRPANPARCIIRNCPGRCDIEPSVCYVIGRARLCKQRQLRTITQDCCRSCPLQATPIPLL